MNRLPSLDPDVLALGASSSTAGVVPTFGGIPGVAEKIERLRIIDPEFDDYIASIPTVRVFVNEDHLALKGKILLSHIDEEGGGREAAIIMVERGSGVKSALIFVRRHVNGYGNEWAIPAGPLSPGLQKWSSKAVIELNDSELGSVMLALYGYRSPH